MIAAVGRALFGRRIWEVNEMASRESCVQASGLYGAKFWCEVGNQEGFPTGCGSMIEEDKFLGRFGWKYPMGQMPHNPVPTPE